MKQLKNKTKIKTGLTIQPSRFFSFDFSKRSSV